MVQKELNDDTLHDSNPVGGGGAGGGKINQPGQLAPHPSDKGNQTERWMYTNHFG